MSQNTYKPDDWHPLFSKDDIAAMREQMCLTRKQLAQLLHYSWPTVRSWELGKLAIPDETAAKFLYIYMQRYPNSPTASEKTITAPLAS